jgi:hypothetical protein
VPTEKLRTQSRIEPGSARRLASPDIRLARNSAFLRGNERNVTEHDNFSNLNKLAYNFRAEKCR